MRVSQVATSWGISSRQVYRLIESGVLPAVAKARDHPVMGYEVDAALVATVYGALERLGFPKGQLAEIIEEVK